MRIFGTFHRFFSGVICSPYYLYSSQKLSQVSRTALKNPHAFSVRTTLKPVGFMIVVILFAFPFVTHAAVVINEIAWMGTEISANDEWIELYNDSGTSVDVDGWVLEDGMNLSIELNGTIASGQYAVLERTDDVSAPGDAFLIYAGALTNTGATLSLYRDDNALEDRVVGGEGWEDVGGDNVTKETAQYTIGGWVTGEATPGSVNTITTSDKGDVDESEEDEEEDNNDDTTISSVSTLHLTPRTPQSNIDVPSRVYVNQEVSMNVRPSGLAESILRSLTHQWNFGDFTTGVGKETTHRFQYPGEYVVTLRSQYGDYESYTRTTVTVLPVSFSMTTNASGDLQVHNDARYEVYLSGYRIVAGKTLTFPPRTILLPNATITIPKEKLQYSGDSTAALFDDTATFVASVSPTISLPSPDVVQQVVYNQAPTIVSAVHIPVSPPEVSPDNFSFAGEVKESVETPTSTLPIGKTYGDEGSLQMAAPIEASSTFPEEKLPYFALLAVIGLGVTAVFAGRVK